MNHRRIRPWEIWQMTLSEICVALEEDEPRIPGHLWRGNMSEEAMLAYAREYRSLTPREKLRRLKLGIL
jgi:hypothetical protein